MRQIGCVVLIWGVASSCSTFASGGDRSLSQAAARSHASVQRVNAEGAHAGASFAARGGGEGSRIGNAGSGGGMGGAASGGGMGNAANGGGMGDAASGGGMGNAARGGALSSVTGGSAAACEACSGETRSAELPSETAPSTVTSPKFKNPEDAWIGLSAAQVTRAAAGGRGGWGPKNVSYSGGPPRVTRRGDIWTLEWIPGGCSDFSAALTLRFVNGRVKRAELDRHHRHTGMECALSQ